MKKYTDAQKKEILSYSIKEAVEKFGVTESTYYKWKKADGGAGGKVGFSVSLEDEYLVVRVPKKMVTKQLFAGLL